MMYTMNPYINAATLLFGVALVIYLAYHTVQGIRQQARHNKVREDRFEQEAQEWLESRKENGE